MKIFISWSKEKSMHFAIKTKEFLESVSPKMEVFVSEVDIEAGDDVQEKIIEKIRECNKLVICFTKDNKKSPWLLYEAGYARGIDKTVIPLLFDRDPYWHSWIDNPMNIAKEISFDNSNFISILLTEFNISATKSNKIKAEKYVNSIMLIKEKFRDVDVQCEDFIEKLIHNNAFMVENPFYKNRTAHFLSGFESFDLYKIIIETFMYTGKYLWIYGRKNMKLFSGSFKDFFKYLEEKTYSGMDGIDFRCLFLDPTSNEVNKAHPQQEIFKPELRACILRAKATIRDNKALENCFRLYSTKREEIIIRIDNCIIYSRPIFDVYGHPQLLTNTEFEVFSSDSPKGINCIQKYEDVWNNAKKFSDYN